MNCNNPQIYIFRRIGVSKATDYKKLDKRRLSKRIKASTTAYKEGKRTFKA